MTRQLDGRVWAIRSQETAGNVTVSFPEHQNRHSKVNHQFVPVVVQRIHGHSKVPRRYYDEYIYEDKEKDAVTGKWVLNVIAAHEAYKKALKSQKQHSQPTIIQASSVN